MYEQEVLELKYMLKLVDWIQHTWSLDIHQALQLLKDIEGLFDAKRGSKKPRPKPGQQSIER